MSSSPQTGDDDPNATGHVVIVCAGWSIPKPFAPDFPASGSHLERYASRLSGVEINSSFYRPHRTLTYVKWSACVPDAFRFAVKVPKSITHERRQLAGLVEQSRLRPELSR